MVWYEQSIEKKNDLSDIGLVGISRAQKLNWIHSVYAKYDFNNLNG